MNISGFHKVLYHGKETDLRYIAKVENLKYKDLLKHVLIDEKNIVDAISELKNGR